MSDTYSDEAQIIIGYAQIQVTARYFLLSAVTLLAYDTILTFPREVKCIIKRQWNFVTAIFWANRYATLASLAIHLLETLWVPPNLASCKALIYSWQTLYLIGALAVAAFACLRVWAICGGEWIPLAMVLMFSLFDPAINLYNYTNPHIDTLEPSGRFAGCGQSIISRPFLYLPVITRTIAVSGDAIVLYFTLKQTWSIVRDAKGLKIKQTLGALLLRNGALQFSILLSLNVVTIILATLAIGANITSSATAFVYVANAGSSITVSRFLLNLRTIYFAASDGTRNGEETQKTSTIKWGSIVGNIGAPLDSLFDDTDGTAGDDPDSAVEDSDSQKVYSQNPLSDGLMQLWETEEKAPTTGTHTVDVDEGHGDMELHSMP